MLRTLLPPARQSLGRALVITRREVRDNWRDWRIVTPIVLLTLIFPFIMDFTSRWATNSVIQLGGAKLLVDRLNPFLAMIVGFFPLSFSLIIALESFAGEKERNSLEPILATPLTDLELYLGKILSSLCLPLLASYLGIAVFLASRLLRPPLWLPPFELLSLLFLLNTAEALVMVTGAVIVSSQTTSVRAANLLSSFIIIPMALLMQAASVIMFYGDYQALWWIVLGLVVVNLILVRMGLRIFNREELLGKELDELNLGQVWHTFAGYLVAAPDLAAGSSPARFSLARFYRHDLPVLLRQQALPLVVSAGVALVAGLLGAGLAREHPMPPAALPLQQLSSLDTWHGFRAAGGVTLFNPAPIFLNNLRVVLLAGLLGLFSFGSLPLCLAGINAGLVGWLVTSVAGQGYNPWLFAAAFILPHGLLEIPAVLIGITFALRLGAAVTAPPRGLSIGQALLLAGANFVKMLFLLVIPLLLLAALVEAYVTPLVVRVVYGG